MEKFPPCSAPYPVRAQRVFFGRVKIGGKIVRHTLKTDVFTTARLRLGDFLKAQRKRASDRRYDVICFRNGYAGNAPEMWVEWRAVRRHGTARSGYYAIRLGRILKIKPWRG